MYYLCGGIDLLLNAVNGSVSGRTRCPVCGKNISDTLRRSTVKQLTPPDAMVYAHETPDAECGRRVVYSSSALFDSKECIGE